jgi:cytochrome c55X
MPLLAPCFRLWPLFVWLVSLPTLAGDEPSASRQTELETLLYQDCGSCHGMTLRGGLGPALPKERMRAYDRDALAGLILHGIPGTAMPGWEGLLSEQDARWLADHLQNDSPLER